MSFKIGKIILQRFHCCYEVLNENLFATFKIPLTYGNHEEKLEKESHSYLVEVMERKDVRDCKATILLRQINIGKNRASFFSFIYPIIEALEANSSCEYLHVGFFFSP